MLHNLFLDRNHKDGSTFHEWFDYCLPSNASELTLITALRTVRAALNEIYPSDSDSVALFLGVDEYQKLDGDDGGEGEAAQGEEAAAAPLMITQLLELLVEYCCNPLPDLTLYPMFAGTRWTKLRNIANDSISIE